MSQATKDLIVDPELQSLIPPLASDELAQLEVSIKEDGCRDPLVVWDGVLVDGHNRYEICTRNGIEFNVVERSFESKDAVKVWMIDNQKGRRNLTDGWKFELAQTRKALLLEKGKQNKGANQYSPKRVLSKVDKTHKHDTRQELANELGWSTGKVAMADKVWKDAEPEVKDKIKAGETSINEAYQKMKKQENRDYAITGEVSSHRRS